MELGKASSLNLLIQHNLIFILKYAEFKDAPSFILTRETAFIDLKK